MADADFEPITTCYWWPGVITDKYRSCFLKNKTVNLETESSLYWEMIYGTNVHILYIILAGSTLQTERMHG